MQAPRETNAGDSDGMYRPRTHRDGAGVHQAMCPPKATYERISASREKLGAFWHGYNPSMLMAVYCCGIIACVQKLSSTRVQRSLLSSSALHDAEKYGITHIVYDNACKLLRHIMK